MSTVDFPLYCKLWKKVEENQQSQYPFTEEKNCEQIHKLLSESLIQLSSQFDRKLVEYHYGIIFLLITHHFQLHHRSSSFRGSQQRQQTYKYNLVSKKTSNGVIFNLDNLPFDLKLLLRQYLLDIQP